MASSIGLLLGTALVAVAAYFRRGRGRGARWWVADEPVGVWGTQAGLVMGVIPGAGLLVLAFSLGALEARWTTALGGLLVLVAIAVLLVGTVVPRLVGPAWWRRERRSARQRRR